MNIKFNKIPFKNIIILYNNLKLGKLNNKINLLSNIKNINVILKKKINSNLKQRFNKNNNNLYKYTGKTIKKINNNYYILKNL